MEDDDNDDDGESRTASVGTKRNLTAGRGASSSRSSSSKRSKPPGLASENSGDLVSTGIALSTSSDLLALDGTNSHRSDHISVPYQPRVSSNSSGDRSNMASAGGPNLGKNRLATGFGVDRTTLSNPRGYHDREPERHPSLTPSLETSEDDAIEISDDEMEDSDIGHDMVLNVEGQDSVERDSGRVSNHQAAEQGSGGVGTGFHETISLPSDERDAHTELPQVNDRSSASAMPATGSTHPRRLRLVDLDPDQLELQVKYTLFHLDRDQIDLNRPVTCLSCLEEGHLSDACTETHCSHCEGRHSSRLCPENRRCPKCRERGHDAESCVSEMKVTTVPCDLCGSYKHFEDTCPHRFFPTASNNGPTRLWISCCICASKSHLVGDCPDLDRTSAARWSLKSIPPAHITNMSLERGTKAREIEAENRGMRPPGIQLKGHAGRHQAGVPGAEDSSEDDDEASFLGPKVARADPRGTFTFRHSTRFRSGSPGPGPTSRYDRYEAPSDERRYRGRPRNDWYATDSFGGRRSRSPGFRSALTGPDRGSRRSVSPRRFDGYQQVAARPRRQRSRSPPPVDRYRPRQQQPDGPGGTETQPLSASFEPGRDAAKQLPVRRGSHAWVDSSDKLPADDRSEAARDSGDCTNQTSRALPRPHEDNPDQDDGQKSSSSRKQSKKRRVRQKRNKSGAKRNTA